jgi:hypothetical protein
VVDRLRGLLVEHGLVTRAGGDDPVFGDFDQPTCHDAVSATGSKPDWSRSRCAVSIGIMMDRNGHLSPNSIDETRRQGDDYFG